MQMYSTSHISSKVFEPKTNSFFKVSSMYNDPRFGVCNEEMYYILNNSACIEMKWTEMNWNGIDFEVREAKKLMGLIHVLGSHTLGDDPNHII